jgi:hypothetical protein
MAFSGTGKVWMNGRIVDWKDATIHIASHVIHYGSAVFEGARCYKTPKGSAFFRLEAHMRRLYDSARIYRMDYALDQQALTRGVVDTVKANGLEACYIRPVIYRGYHTLGVNPLPCPVDAVILVWEWGAYLGAGALENGVDVCVSSWTRSAPNTFPAMAKSVANYANSSLIKMEAVADGYSEGIALDPEGHRLGDDAGAGHGDSGARAGPAARDAVRRRRGVLRWHGGGNHAGPVGRQDSDRLRHPGTGHQRLTDRVLRLHQWRCAGPARLADPGCHPRAATRTGRHTVKTGILGPPDSGAPWCRRRHAFCEALRGRP